MRVRICGVLALVAAAGLAQTVFGQVERSRTSTVEMGNSIHTARLPYTAEYKIARVQTLQDGTTITHESTEVIALDSQGRRMTANANVSASEDQTPITRVSVFDPVARTNSYWSSPGTAATVTHAPDLGEPETECAKQVKAIDALHPAVSGEKPAVQDLGTKTIDGVTAHGGRISFTPSLFRMGAEPHVRTNEMWSAVDPALDGLIVRLVSDGGPEGKTTRELVSFNQSEPDPAVFQVPANRAITTKNGQAYYCGIAPKAKP
jgi:hypothetical protein